MSEGLQPALCESSDARTAVSTLRSLYQRSLSGPGGGQWFHEYERVPGEKHEIVHRPGNCRVCAAFDLIESALLDVIGGKNSDA